MGSEWIDAKLGDYIDSCLGKMLDKNKNKGEFYPYLGNSNVRWGAFDLDELAQMKFEDHEHVRYGIKAGDLIVCEGGEPGRCAIWEDDLPNMKIQKALHRVRTLDGLDSEFLYYWFLLAGKNKLLDAYFTGTTIKHLTGKALKEIPIKIPPLNHQKQVAVLLRSFDKKIKINRQINQTLEQMAQTLFKSWFVDFDPVKTKMNGEQPKGMDAATASLFPEKLVESELGLIPEGWEIHKTQDLFDVKDGTHDSPKKAEEGHYLVTSKHITKGKIDTSSAYQISDADFEKVNQRSKVDTFDILLTMIGTVGEVVVVYDNPVEFAIKNVGLFKTSQKPELVWLFYWHLQSFKMKHYLEARMAGTTQQYLTLKTLRTIPVVLPSDELLAKFNEVLSPLMEKISDNHKQSHTLSNLRDTLLPKLLSGEIDLENLQVEQAKALAE
ncbi:restriction endonuclease subunit S [Vibrio sp. 10N.286.49.F3]|uniref:restriction endonuclease subunit S n=1 Tax=unclassified Vibrio TaxID=2614977 RepID=UPI000C84AAD7|nr:restriction endonuclease subunit S [Vibrio sp. 10N.222.55.F9]PMN95915.1 restriction endonuclease subunit S [Vibrio sp. 10N.222.55.F9]